MSLDGRGRPSPHKLDLHLPHAAGVLSHHRLAGLAAEGGAKLRHVCDHAVGSILLGRVRIHGCPQALILLALVRAPALAVGDEEALLGRQAIERVQLLLLCIFLPRQIGQ